MKEFRDRIAVITGGGTGMGRELARQLAAEGCHVALCDVSAGHMAEPRSLCEQKAPRSTRVTTHACAVSDERQVLAFRDAVKQQHATDHAEDRPVRGRRGNPLLHQGRLPFRCRCSIASRTKNLN